MSFKNRKSCLRRTTMLYQIKFLPIEFLTQGLHKAALCNALGPYWGNSVFLHGRCCILHARRYIVHGRCYILHAKRCILHSRCYSLYARRCPEDTDLVRVWYQSGSILVPFWYKTAAGLVLLCHRSGGGGSARGRYADPKLGICQPGGPP